MGVRRLAAALALAAAAAGCGRADPRAGVATAPPASAPPAAASATAAPSPRLSDPAWLRARDEDPLEKQRLAEAAGAAELLLGVADGGETARVALAALPYADDADLALGPLGERALAAAPADVGPVLLAVLGIAGRPPRQREPLDLEGARACGAAMITLAGRATLDAADRALAVSAARALAERGVVDRGRIPNDLDPR